MATYDDLYRNSEAVFGENPLPLVEHILDHKISGKVLDIGSGYGRNSLFLAQKGFRITAVDSSPVAIKQLSARAQDLGLPITATVQKAEDIILNVPYDIVLACFVLHHLSDTAARRLIHCLQEHTPVGSIHAIAAFTCKGDFYREKPEHKEYFYPRPGELKKLYTGWGILMWEEGEGDAFKKKKSGAPMRNTASKLLVQKIQNQAR